MPASPPKKSRRAARHVKAVNIALQGGGSHGAFTWGVLDKLFEDDRVWVEAISGTSAGAMNAVVAAQGMYDEVLESGQCVWAVQPDPTHPLGADAGVVVFGRQPDVSMDEPGPEFRCAKRFQPTEHQPATHHAE